MTSITKPIGLPGKSQTRQPSPADHHGYGTAEDLPKTPLVPQRTVQAGHFLKLFLEMQIPMLLGALGCFLLGRLIPASSSFATIYHRGTFLFAIGDILYLTLPVMAWMVLRRHGWRHSLAMGVAMIAPVVAIIVLSQLAGSAYLLWLVTGMYPAMCLGMLVYMLYRAIRR